MNFAALVSAAGIFPPNEYAEKRKGGRSPEYSGTPPPFLSG